jgi:hypothetical protein
MTSSVTNITQKHGGAMARYKYGEFFSQSQHEIFDKLHDVHDEVPLSGIYRCEGCGREISANKEDPFPPQNHHQHATSQGKIRWRLIVRTSPRPRK